MSAECPTDLLIAPLALTKSRFDKGDQAVALVETVSEKCQPIATGANVLVCDKDLDAEILEDCAD